MNTEESLIRIIKTNVTAHNMSIGRHTINYVTCGRGKPIVLIHGGNIGWGQWYPNLVALAKQFSVYAIDLPGAGRSSRVDYAQLHLERDLVEVVEQFIRKKNLAAPHVIGSSIGGWISLRLALRKKVKLGSLILVDSIGFMDYMKLSDRIIGFYPFALLLSKTVLRPDRSNKKIEVFLRSVFWDHQTFLAPEFIDYFYDTMRASHNLLFISRLSGVLGMRKEFILQPVLSNVTNKILILWGENDQLMPVGKNYQNFSLLPNAHSKIIKEAGHIPSIEKSHEFNREVVKFLSI